MVEPDALLQVAHGVLDLGVAAVVGLQSERLALAIGDEGVVVVERNAAPAGCQAWGAPGARLAAPVGRPSCRRTGCGWSRPRRHHPQASRGSASRPARGWPRSAAGWLRVDSPARREAIRLVEVRAQSRRTRHGHGLYSPGRAIGGRRARAPHGGPLRFPSPSGRASRRTLEVRARADGLYLDEAARAERYQ
jgi:hypothetical protein